ncbi:hypothetical protein BJV78DRAFT_1277264 [Lactifluus subvellereus]|nr:hypothetical protein BJV78DRAFT_1277264 [Lactifluus subvellereus]
MPGTEIDKLMQIWADLLPADQDPPYADHSDVYNTIDSTILGDAPWQSFSVAYTGELPVVGDIPPWMLVEYDIWCRDPRVILQIQLGNPDFKDEFDYAPFQRFDDNGEREWKDFMSVNWGYWQADIIAKDPQTHGALFVPVILGSDKTTVSVATGQNEFYPLYISNGNIHNNVRCAHHDGVSVLRFLSIPKNDDRFRMFRLTQCPDGHFCHVIYGLGPYIADYPEQALLACIVQGWCPKCTAPADHLDSAEAGRHSHLHTDALLSVYSLKILWEDYGIVGDVVPFTARFPRSDIHELLCSDLLHQIIKGTFKDHLVTWVGEYLVSVHGSTRTAAIMADIDRRIAAAPPFPGQRRFPEGRGFKQWTRDDSKALMKVYLPAISGHVPPQMVRCFAAFLEFCYPVRRDSINETTLEAINVALGRFHKERTIFEESGLRIDFNLPRQHSLKHYQRNIQLFGAPNGLCSSITESKHIKAMKEPWRQSSHFNALGQMLVMNQRIDKLSASRVNFASHGLLSSVYMSVCLGPNDKPLVLFSDCDATQVSGLRVHSMVTLAMTRETGYPLQLEELAASLNLPLCSAHIRCFLFDQLHPNAPLSGNEVDLNICPTFSSNIHIFHSALATFYAPSDHSGIRGMHHQRIRATPSWQGCYGSTGRGHDLCDSGVGKSNLVRGQRARGPKRDTSGGHVDARVKLSSSE